MGTPSVEHNDYFPVMDLQSVYDVFGIPRQTQRPSVTEVAIKRLYADLYYLSMPIVLDEKISEYYPPSEKAHLEDITRQYIKKNQVEAFVPFNKSAFMLPAAKQDALAMLSAFNFEHGRDPWIQARINALANKLPQTILSEAPKIYIDIYRKSMYRMLNAMKKQAEQAEGNLFGTSSADERELAGFFTSIQPEIQLAIDHLDAGNLDMALYKYNDILHVSEGYVDWFQRVAERDQDFRSLSHLGITFVAACAAAFTGGLTLELAGVELANATISAIGIVALTASMFASGTTFVVTERLMASKIFDQPFFDRDTTLENAADFTGDVLYSTLLFGVLKSFGILSEALGSATGEMATAINAIKSFTVELAGLTVFNMVGSASALIIPEDYPDLEESISLQALANNFVTLLGLRAGFKTFELTGKALIDTARALPKTFEWTSTQFGEFHNWLYEARNGHLLPTNPYSLKQFLNRAPIAVIGFININLSYAMSLGVRYVVDSVIPSFGDVLPALFNSSQGNAAFFSAHTIFETWARTNIFGNLVAIPMFAGIKTFFPRQSTELTKKIEKYFGLDPETKLPTESNIPLLYAKRFLLEGLMGINRLVGARNQTELSFLTDVKNFLKSNPVEYVATLLLKSLSETRALRPVIQSLDGLLYFMGDVTPNRKGALIGFTTDILGNAGIEIIYSVIFHSSRTVPELILPGLLINSLVAFANTSITQHDKFSFPEQFLHRTGIGIMKSGVYRGFCVSGAVTDGLNYAVQGLYGLFAMGYANRITRGKVETPAPIVGKGIMEVVSAPVNGNNGASKLNGHGKTGREDSIRSPMFLQAKSAEKAHPPRQGDVARMALESAITKGSVTIVVVDSGLAGSIVAADASTKLRAAAPHVYGKVIYVNVRPNEGTGYNELSPTRQVEVFNNSLTSIQERFSPDLIVLGCNTLSVIAPGTAFAKSQKTPLLGIDRASVGLMLAAHAQSPNAPIIIFGTPITIRSDVYASRLRQDGVPSHQIIGQPCAELAKTIEYGQMSRAQELIDGFVGEAINALPKGSEAPIISLNCTHFGIAMPIWMAAFQKRGIEPRVILDPTRSMLNEMLEGTNGTTLAPRPITPSQGGLAVSIVSQVPITPAEASSFGRLVSDICPETSRAFSRPNHVPNLFEWESPANKSTGLQTK